MLVDSPLPDSSLFDSHCHFDFEAFEQKQASIWQECQQQGINKLVIPGIEPAQWPKAHQLSQSLPGVYAAFGLHPWWVEKISESPDQFQKTLASWLASHPECVALGECGLDGGISLATEQQQAYLDVQLQLACEYQLPVILHGHKAHNPLLQSLKRFNLPQGGVIHGFSGSLELALSYWRMGIRIGVGGSVTYPRANKTRNAVSQLPLQAIVLETDAPDMPLYGFQGEPNNPLRLVDVAKAVAELRSEFLLQVSEQTTRNSCELFGLA
jgi:TatD DNase family protein